MAYEGQILRNTYADLEDLCDKQDVYIMQQAERLAIAITVLEFYADKESWNKSEPQGWDHVIKGDDLSQDDCLRWVRSWGGKRAREALAKLKHDNKPIAKEKR